MKKILLVLALLITSFSYASSNFGLAPDSSMRYYEKSNCRYEGSELVDGKIQVHYLGVIRLWDDTKRKYDISFEGTAIIKNSFEFEKARAHEKANDKCKKSMNSYVKDFPDMFPKIKPLKK